MARWLTLAVLTLGLALAASAQEQDQPPADPQPRSIPMGEFETVLARGMAEGKVTVIYFTADWCGWCRKLETSAFVDPDVIRAAEPFVFAKVDVDEEPQVAAIFGAFGLPSFYMINARGELLDQRNGYLTPTDLKQWLDESAGKALAPGVFQDALLTLTATRRELETMEPGPEADATVVKVVEGLSRSQRLGRAETKQALVAAGAKAWPGLAACLEREELAIRAAGSDVLKASTGAGLAFDPFADEPTRAEQVKQWRRWIDSAAVLSD